jgi:hypothetical protein
MARKAKPPVPIGTRLRVWWEEEEAWFSGTVKAYLVEDDTHLVVYDDGDEQHEPLGDASLRWERLEPALATGTAHAAQARRRTPMSDDDEDYADDGGKGAYSGDEDYLSVVDEEQRAKAAAEAEREAPHATQTARAKAVPAAKEKLATTSSRALQALTVEDSTDGLDDLLSGSPVTPERFLADHWERTVLHLPRDDELPSSSSSVSSPTRPSTTRTPTSSSFSSKAPSTTSSARRPEGAFGGLLRLEDLDALLCHAACPASSAELLVFEGLRQVELYATPYAAYASGASVVVNHADKVWPPANELCARLGRRFGHAYANLYLTPGDSQTAPPHSDDRDVFVLQLHGEKAWLVWSAEEAGSQPLPYTDEMVGKGAELLTEAALGDPTLSCTLRPGDLLYIPRGAPHVARTAGCSASPSMHLTIAIPTADLCWSGLAKQALAAAAGFGRPYAGFDLPGASPRAHTSEMSYRRALPLGPLPCLPPAAPVRGPALTAFIASSASGAAAMSEAEAAAAKAEAADVAAIPGGPSSTYDRQVEDQHWSSTYDLLHAQLCGARHARY